MPGLEPNSQRKKTKRLPSLRGTEALWDLELVEEGKRHCMGTSKVLILHPRQLGSSGTKPGPWGSSQSCRAWGGGPGVGQLVSEKERQLTAGPRPGLAGARSLWESHSLQISKEREHRPEEELTAFHSLLNVGKEG